MDRPLQTPAHKHRQQTCDKISLIGNEREGIDIQRGVSDLTLNP